MHRSSDHRFAGGEKEGTDGGLLRTQGCGRLLVAGPPGSPLLTLLHLSFVQTADDEPCDKGRPGICPLCAWTRSLFCRLSEQAPPAPPLGGLCPSGTPPGTSLPALPAGPTCSLRHAELVGPRAQLSPDSGWAGHVTCLGSGQETGGQGEGILRILTGSNSEGLEWGLLTPNPYRVWKGCLWPKREALGETEERVYLGLTQAFVPSPCEAPSQRVLPGHPQPGASGLGCVSILAHRPPSLCLLPRDL